MIAANFTNHFLIAMPTLADPNFSQTVTLICEHNKEGALGIVVNRPLNLHLHDLFKHLGINTVVTEVTPVFSGGPVHIEHGFVLHTPLGLWESTLKVNHHLGLTTSRDILAAIAAGNGPQKSLVSLGYAGWGPGQLEDEIADNAWLTVPQDAEILFDLPAEQRWKAAATKLGIDLNLLAGEAGHA